MSCKTAGVRRPAAGAFFARIVAAVSLVAVGCATIGGGAQAAPPDSSPLVPVFAASKPGTTPEAARTSPKAIAATSGWAGGFCNALLQGGPGTVGTAWVSLEQQAIDQVMKMYGQTLVTDPLQSTALVKARGMTRALMFANLVKAIKDVSAGTATTDQANQVAAFRQAVKYGRQWIAIEAVNSWNAYSGSYAYQSVITNNLMQIAFAWIGLPWRNDSKIPSSGELLAQAQTKLWGAPATTNGGAAGDIQNYPLTGAESAQAMHSTVEALAFLSALGYSHVLTPGGDPSLSPALASVQQALGILSSGEMGGAVMDIANLATIIASGDGMSVNSGRIQSLVNTVWTAADTIASSVELDKNMQIAFGEPDLVAALNDSTQFGELFNDFMALTLHPLPNAGGTGNDPDCRMTNKGPGATPPAMDATLSVSHFTHGAVTTNDYSYTTQTLGGNVPGQMGPPVPNGVNAISFPSVLDWSYARDLGPGAPRMGANWPISQITYGIPGDYSSGFGLAAPSVFWPVSGWWYITFKGANGVEHTTAPLKVYQDATAVHPTDSEVASAIVNADPIDFPTGPCPPSGGLTWDPAIPSKDRANYPCLAWDPATGVGTALIVSGNQPDGNLKSANYMPIFNIMVKGDLGGWSPTFVGHGGKGPGQFSECQITADDSVSRGVCVTTPALGIPLTGDVVESRVLWTPQMNELCVNDPRTCATVPSYGWPTPYPVNRECQSVSPAGGMFVIKYVGQVDPANPAGSCANTPDAGSWTVTPNIHYRSIDGSLWNAWRVPQTLATAGTARFLSIQAAQRLSGSAAIDLSCYAQTRGSENGRCIQGSNTHWLSEFRSGDTIMLSDPARPQNNSLGGFLSMTRKIQTVIDDTHILLGSSIECVSGTDGNDCEMFSMYGYTSFMHPVDGTTGVGLGMVTPCTTYPCISAPPDYRFEVYRVTGLNPGTTCPVWTPGGATDHPPTSGCYYSDALQFQAQTYAADGANLWWNVSLPSFPPTIAPPGTGIETKALNTAPAWLGQPAVTLQPESVTTNVDASATFTAAASGSPAPTVKWQLSTNSGVTWSDIPNATAATYAVAHVTQAHNGNKYRAIFTNAAGARTTHWATLGVYARPVITQNPQSIPSAVPGSPFAFSADATGAPQPVPTWQMSTDGGATWQDLTGGHSTLAMIWPPTLPVSPLFRVVYRNDAGTAISSPATLGSPALVPPIAAKLDVDASSTATKYDPITDGLIVLRYLFGITGPALTNGSLGATATRTDPDVVKAYLDIIRPSLDIDGNGKIEPLTDGLLVLRYMLGLRDAALVTGAFDPMGSRNSAGAIQAHIGSLMP